MPIFSRPGLIQVGASLPPVSPPVTKALIAAIQAVANAAAPVATAPKPA